MERKKLISKISVFLMVLMISCNHTYIPKPEGFVRVVYPDKAYMLFDTTAPFSFEYPVYAELLPNRSVDAEDYWYDLNIPAFNGTIYISYKYVDNNLDAYIEDARTLVYKHTSRAEGILEIPYYDGEHNKSGILYELEGNVASPIQFFVTDSSEHFLRGSLYFNVTPNRDSLNPIIDFVEEDILHLVESLMWN